MMKIKTTTTALSYAAIGLCIGLVGQFLQRQLWSSDKNPIVEACTSVEYKSMEDFVTRSGYSQPYNRQLGLILGDPMICIVTQQMYEWISTSSSSSSSISGLLLMSVKLIQFELPIFVLILIEAGRQDNKGILLWPTLISLLSYCLGTSIIFPSLWVTCYCLLGDDHYHSFEGGTTDSMRGPIALLAALPPTVLFVLTTMYWNTDSYLWNIGVALLGSPILALLPPLALRKLPPPPSSSPEEEISSKEAILSAKVLAATYAVMGILTFVGWMGFLYVFATSYGTITKIGQFGKDVWYDGSVKTLLVEIWTLTMASLTLIASRSEWSALEAVILSPFVGPGAAAAIELASLELEKYSIPVHTVRVPVSPNKTSSSASNNNNNSSSNHSKRNKKKKKQH